MARNKGKLMSSLDVLVAIREAAKGCSSFESCDIDCDNDSGTIIFKMFDGTEWIISSKDIRPVEN